MPGQPRAQPASTQDPSTQLLISQLREVQRRLRIGDATAIPEAEKLLKKSPEEDHDSRHSIAP